MKIFREFAITAGSYTVSCIALFLMIRLTAQYIHFDTDVAFLSLKQEYLHIDVWLISFYIHVFSTSFCLLAAFTQFSSTLLRKYKRVHKVMGKLYVFNIVFINFPVAFIMALYANGGYPSKVAFVILDVLWFWFTLKAWMLIRKGDIIAHQNFMIRSFALTFSAITLRSWKLVLTSTTGLSEPDIYMIDAWLGFVPNLVVAEVIIYLKMKKLSTKLYL